MSNTSPFNENKNNNNNVMFPQGGEKKVMKKILSVALSTAMAFSMFASVAFGDTAVTPQDKFDALKAKGIFSGYPDGTAGLEKEMTRAEFAKVITKVLGLKEVTGVLSYNDKGYTAKNWAVPYIEAVSAAGIMEGKNVTKKIFDYNGKVTVEEMATVLTRALELEVPTTVDNSASTWAKGYVQAAIEAGLVSKDAKFQSNATRSLLVEAAYAVDQIKSVPTVASYVVSEGGKVVEFTLSNKEVVKVTLEKALEANKETEVTFKDAAGKEITTKVIWKVESATKLESATSTNLREVDVVFDGKVDKASATDKDNYSINSGAKAIKSVSVLADGKTVRVLLDANTFVQGQEYKIVVKNVKSSLGNTLSTGEVKFTSSDNVLPTVTEVKALGNKAIKVTFSEPVKNVASTNFKLDDKSFIGSVTKGADEREVILKDYAGSVALGAHKLTTALVEDFAGLKSLSATSEFTVVEDKEGPTVTEITATLEKVTITFNEEIDPDSVKSDSFYWKSGDSKKVAKAKQVSANVYELDFTENRLPGYETTLFVEVKDYSGNANAVKEHKVTATVDLTRPKVEDVAYGKNGKVLTIKFDKPVYGAADRANYTIKKGDDVYPVTGIVASPGDTSNRSFDLSFSSTLPEGEFNLRVNGVQDRTALKNTISDYTTTFKVDDTNRPTLSKEIDANNTTRTLVVNFDKKMDVASITNHSNYIVDFVINNQTVTKTLPSDVSIRPVLEGRAVQLVFPESIDGTNTPVRFGQSVKNITVIGVKSASGNVLNTNYVPKAIQERVAKATGAVQKDYRTIEVTFDQAVSQAYVTDFLVGGATISSVSISDGGDVVTIKTDQDINGSGVNVEVRNNNNIRTYAGNGVEFSTHNTLSSAAPKVLNQTIFMEANGFVVPFNTTLKSENSGMFGSDLIIKQEDATNKTKLTAGVDYRTTWKAAGVSVEFNATSLVSNYKGKYSVQVKDNAEYIRGLNGKLAQKSDVIQISGITTNPVEKAKITNVSATTPVNNGVAAQADLTLTAGKKITLTAKEVGTKNNGYAVIVGEDTTNIPVNTVTANINVNDKVISIKVNDATVKQVADQLATVQGIIDLFNVTGDTADTTKVDLFGGETTKSGENAVPASVVLTADKASDFQAVALFTKADKSDEPKIIAKSDITISTNGLTLTVKLPADVTYVAADLL
ncbi:MAG TPA: S-layer homology domain-containing protein [Paenibacillus sp.]